ncbi:MAG: biliverdin-producing heme oxygenase [Chitinophagaceae bacterium]|nr:biliverdin-producing heme oxygenase [Chitinophagaceae bacterium]
MKPSEILKQSTRKIHQEVEKIVVLRIKSIRTDEDYIDLLKYFYAYFAAVEKAAAPYITDKILPDYTERRNASYIRTDIYELGGETDALPIPNPPAIENSLQAMSALYVLEGSVIGGPYIVEMLKKIGISKGFSFFSGYGDKAEEKWAAFTQYLDALTENEADKRQSLDVALLTFRQFGNIFGQQIIAVG